MNNEIGSDEHDDVTDDWPAGRTVVVTGGAGGIGAATADQFAGRGARVAVLDLDASAVDRFAADFAGAMGIAADVTQPDQVRRAFEQITHEWGGVDVLVNNAGITHVSAFAETDVDVIRRVVDVNFWGSVHCTDAALPSLIERRGRIVVVSSIAGFAPLALRTGYAASKHALHGFFESLRAELVDAGVSVTMVCPFYVRTGIENIVGTTDRPVSGNVAEPAEIATAILDGARDRERLVLPSEESQAAYELTRADPAAFEALMLASIAGDA